MTTTSPTTARQSHPSQGTSERPRPATPGPREPLPGNQPVGAARSTDRAALTLAHTSRRFAPQAPRWFEVLVVTAANLAVTVMRFVRKGRGSSPVGAPG